MGNDGDFIGVMLVVKDFVTNKFITREDMWQLREEENFYFIYIYFFPLFFIYLLGKGGYVFGSVG